VPNHEKLLEELPSTIRNKLGIKPSIRAESTDGKMCVVITVIPEGQMIDLDGRYYKRVGSTTHMITGEELRNRILSSKGISWTDLPAEKIGMDRLSKDAIKFFVDKGMESGRMSPEAAKSDAESLLRRYELMDDRGLRNSAAILFLELPGMVFSSPTVKIGAYSEGGRLLRHDRIDCPVVMQPDRVMKVLLDKYVQGTDRIEGLMMVTKYPYPVKAIREAIMNSLSHRDYSSVVETYVRVYPDHIDISNPGSLPPGWTEENLFKKHDSKPANKHIANVFYDMGYIERFGSGLELIEEECNAMGVPLPEYSIEQDRIEITFRLPERPPAAAKVVSFDDLTPIELRIYTIITESDAVTRVEIAESADVSLAAVKRVIAALTEKGFIKRVGSRKSGRWESNVKTVRR